MNTANSYIEFRRKSSYVRKVHSYFLKALISPLLIVIGFLCLTRFNHSNPGVLIFFTLCCIYVCLLLAFLLLSYCSRNIILVNTAGLTLSWFQTMPLDQISNFSLSYRKLKKSSRKSHPYLLVQLQDMQAVLSSYSWLKRIYYRNFVIKRYDALYFEPLVGYNETAYDIVNQLQNYLKQNS